MRRQPLEVQTLYAELLERLGAYEASRAIGRSPGSFVKKRVKGQDYYYFQHLEPGGAQRQTYLGRADEELDRLARRFWEGRAEADEERASTERLAALLRAGGAMLTDTASGRVIRGLADVGVFHLGGVLVGTHAFTVLGNVLGVCWDSALRTQDVDIAAGRDLRVAVPDLTADLPSALESLHMGFLPVPGLAPDNPATSFKVRGQSLRVDLLTPSVRAQARPVVMPRLAAAAQPLRFLDYLIESPIRAAVVDSGATAVNVPDPARFALHKLIVAGERSVAFAAKRDKDLAQAAELLELLHEDRPGDVALAWRALASRGPSWVNRVMRQRPGLKRVSPAAANVVERLADGNGGSR